MIYQTIKQSNLFLRALDVPASRYPERATTTRDNTIQPGYKSHTQAEERTVPRKLPSIALYRVISTNMVESQPRAVQNVRR